MHGCTAPLLVHRSSTTPPWREMEDTIRVPGEAPRVPRGAGVISPSRWPRRSSREIHVRGFSKEERFSWDPPSGGLLTLDSADGENSP